jgi:hypothetical protein
MFKLFRTVLASLVFVILASVTYAFASSADSPKLAGAGVGAIGGYVVTTIDYRLSDDPARVQAVELDLDKPANYVAIKLVSSDTDYSICTNENDNHWYCNVYNINIANIDGFQVIAMGE